MSAYSWNSGRMALFSAILGSARSWLSFVLPVVHNSATIWALRLST